MDVKAKLRETLIGLLKVKPEELKDDVSLEDCLGVDSTEMVETVIALGKTFNIKIEQNEITKSSSLNDIEKVIQSKINS